MMKLKLLILGLVTAFKAFSQDSYINVDSLKHELEGKINDSTKISIYITLSNEYVYIDTDSALMYTNSAEQLALRNNDTIHLIGIKAAYGYIYNTQGNYSEARRNFNDILNYSKIRHDSNMMASAYGNIGNTYMYENKNSLAIEYFLKAMKIFEENNNTKGLATVYGVLGNIYLSLSEYNQALEYYQKGLVLFEQLGWKSYAATSTMNIGIVYKNKKDYDKAIEYFTKAHKVHLELGNLYEAAQCIGNIGNVEFCKGNYSLSIEYHKKSLETLKKVNATREVGTSLMNIGVNYDSLKNYDKASVYYKNALALLDSSDQPSLKRTLAIQISELSKKTKNFEEALKYYELYSIYNDTITSRENRQNLDELLTKYETVQKEKEIELQKEKIWRKNIQVISVSSLLAFIIVLLFILIVNYRRKKQDNLILAEKNRLISQQKEEILTQNEILQQQKEEIEAQRDEVVNQRDQITHQNNLITDSIEYAKHIQNAVLPEKQLLGEYFSDSFIFYQPRNIVSGDFYWMKRFDNCMVIALADCAGHGVPGAFMSMLGITLLNDIVAEQNNVSTNLILEEFRTKVKRSLKQSGERFEAKDGIEIAICSINLNKMEIEYSGANIPLYIVRNNQLMEYLPTRNPIGYHPREIAFEKSTIAINKNDTLYLYSDGFMDQLGGNGYVKFKKQNLHNLLLSNSSLPMEKQVQLLSENLEQWKGTNDQTDDVLVMGIKI
ncbi:MAG: tetratricopeptide repeat protein [Bacteroidales bacterium]